MTLTPTPQLGYKGSRPRGAWLIYRAPGRLFLAIMAGVGLIQAGIAALPPIMPWAAPWVTNSAAAILAAGLAAPLLYLLVFRPFVTHVDYTQQAEASLRESEAELRRLLDSAVDAIVRFDAKGVVVGWNDRAEALFGWTAAEAVGGDAISLIAPPSSRQMYRRALARMAASAGNIPLALRRETEAVRRDGSAFPVDLGVAEVRVGDGVIFSAFLRDITDRKHAEAGVRLAAKVFETSGEGMVITDASGTIIAANPAFSTITGYSNAEAIGNNPRLLQSGRHDTAYYAAMFSSLEREGRWAGEIWNRRKDGVIYPEWLTITRLYDERGRVTNQIASFSDITVRKAAAERIEHMAHYDHLTNLPNRALLEQRLAEAMTRARNNNTRVATLFLDLDRFKAVNDTFGHAAGDILLTEVADRLRLTMRDGDTVARMGGDEFLVVLNEVSDIATVEAVATRIIRSLAEPFYIDGTEVTTGTSIGIAMYPDISDDPDLLVRAADSAMYRAKRNRRGSYRFASLT